MVTVNPVTNNPDATYVISPRDADSTTTDVHDVALRDGQNTRITVTVTAEDRRTRQTYTVTVYRDRSTRSDNANLSALRLDGVSLSPRFSSGTTEYDARVPYDVTTVTVVAATAADIGALVPVVGGGTEVPNSDVTRTIGEVATSTAITVTVTAEDDTTMEIYTIMVYRESGPVLSDDARLGNLALTGATLSSPAAFAAGTTEYTAIAEIDVESVTVSATFTDNPGATVEIIPADQNTSTEDVHEVYLTPGTNTVITATVTAENGSTNTYTVTVYQKRLTESDNADLSALSLDGVSLSPDFDPETTQYDARVPYNVMTVTVAATAADIGALVPVVGGGTEVPNSDVTRTIGEVGTSTAITVTVTAENDSMNTYTIMVYRESGPVLSDEATLTGLILGTGVTLSSPAAFAPGTNEYTARATATTGFATVTWTAADVPAAMVDVMPADQNSLIENHQVYLTPGERTKITVTVTAENGSTNIYTVMVYRARTTASMDATLSALSLDGVSLSPDFDPETTNYDARVRYDVNEVTVEHAAADIGAVVAVTVNETLSGTDAMVKADTTNVVTLSVQGDNTVINVAVTAEDSNATETYILTVYRENIVLSDIATLGAPTSGGDGYLGAGVTLLSPDAFAPGTNEYTARATATTEFATVDAQPTDLGAMVDIMPADRDILEDGHQVYLAPTAHTAITVTVTAENGSTNTYTFLVYRARTTASSDKTLSELILSGAVLSPDFEPSED